MGLILFGFSLSCVVGVIVGKLVLRVLQRYDVGILRKAIAFILGVAVAFAMVAPTTRWLIRASTTTLVAMDSRKGEQRLELFGIPTGTTNDFCYRFSLFGVTIRADFEMAERDFHAWMKSQGWQTKRIVSESEYWNTDGGSDIVLPDVAIVYPVRDYDLEQELEIRKGYYYFEYDQDNRDETTTVIYDLEAGRAYLVYTTY